MAKSGTIKSNSWRYDSESSYIHAELMWNVISQDKTNKTSKIEWKLITNGLRSSGYWYIIYNSKVIINGSVVHSRSYYGKAYNGTVLASGTTTIRHNADGTKSVPISISVGAYWSGTYNLNKSETIQLDKIHTTPPVINSGGVSVSGINQNLLGNSLYGVQNVHTVNINVSAFGKDGATIKNYNINFQGNTYNSQKVSVKITKSGSLPVSVTVTDNRGNSTTKTIATVVSRVYKNPYLSNFSIKRYTNSIEDPMGTTLKALGSVGYTNVLDATGTNVNSPNWKISSEGVTRYTKSISYSKEDVQITVGENWTITYGDKFTSLSTVVSAPKGEPTLVLGKKSVGINYFPTKEDEGLFVSGFGGNTDNYVGQFDGYIKSKGINTLRIEDISTGTKISNYKNSKGLGLILKETDIYYTYDGKDYSLWSAVKNNTSDIRLKKNIKSTNHKAMDIIDRLEFKEYDWIDGPFRQAHTNIGLIAQDIQNIDESLVYEDGDILKLDMLRLINISLKGIKELQEEIKELKEDIQNEKHK
ncbi:tail fiber domain-containing protein [Helcococcus bovis]|uniref:Tail fiber domain-containing protein n=1 Tax=Helcococcus bovis TaxID=3153252 RepID=A0ABW9F786_9FIRM